VSPALLAPGSWKHCRFFTLIKTCVKPDSGKITIKHEPIPNLDMPGMTMVFRTQEGTDISEYRKGDKVTFTVVEKDGKMMIVSIAKAE